jgi:hypothetical protein
MSVTKEMTDSFKLKLLLSCLRITCRYFNGDEYKCSLSLEYIPKDAEDYECHIACNCDGDINQCDLPEKFQTNL